jgi:hypothetical protein
MVYQFQFLRSTQSRPVLLAIACLIVFFAHAATVFAADKLTVYSGRAER